MDYESSSYAASFQKRTKSVSSGGLTRNPFTVEVRIRESSYISGLRDDKAIDTVIDGRTITTVTLHREKTYTLEILDDIGYGALVSKLHIPSDRDSIELGVIRLRENGSLVIWCRTDHIDTSIALTAKIQGLARHTEASVGDPLRFRNLPEGDYNIRMGSSKETFTGSRFKTVRVERGTAVTEWDLSLPVDYRMDSVAVAAFLDSQGVEVDNWDNFVSIKDFRIHTLRLKHLALGHIHPGLGALAFLHGLDLTGSSFLSLPKSIGDIPHLRTIRLDSTTLDSLPDVVQDCDNLRALHLDNNRISTLPAWLKDMPSLEGIYLSRNGLKKIPVEIFSIGTLEILDVKNDTIDSIPAEIGKLATLRILDVRENNVTHIAPEIGSCKGLETIWAYHNNLSSLPDGITTLPFLERLHLEGNRLTGLPEQFGRLQSLKHLNISYNDLVSLPFSTMDCTALVSLDLKRNSICSLPPEFEKWVIEYEGEDWRNRQNGCE